MFVPLFTWYINAHVAYRAYLDQYTEVFVVVHYTSLCLAILKSGLLLLCHCGRNLQEGTKHVHHFTQPKTQKSRIKHRMKYG